MDHFNLAELYLMTFNLAELSSLNVYWITFNLAKFSFNLFTGWLWVLYFMSFNQSELCSGWILINLAELSTGWIKECITALYAWTDDWFKVTDYPVMNRAWSQQVRINEVLL